MYFSNTNDAPATTGLLGTNNSLAYRIHEIERHFHGWDRRVGLAAAPSGETHRADILGPGVAAFQATTGNNTWGAWLQIIGSSDTPKQSGYVKFDLHNLLVTNASYNGVYFCQFACGESAALAAKVAAYEYSSHIYQATSAALRTSTEPMMMRRCTAGDKVWMRIMVSGQDAKTLDFYLGFHEYEG